MRSSLLSDGASALAAAAAAPGSGTSTRLVRRLARHARTGLLRVADPVIRYEVAGFPLALPLSHELPAYLLQHPDYGSNAGRVAGVLAAQDPACTVVDIGANVGDTAAFIRRNCGAPVLCVEGEPRFFSLLRENAAVIGGVDVELANIGAANEEVAARTVSSGGTARLERGGGETVRLRRLEQVLAMHPGFLHPRLVKIDTDGFDLTILAAHLDLFEQLRPALFFEYDPVFFVDPAEGLRVLEQLRGRGYGEALVWDNVGDFLLRLPLSNRSALEDLDAYFSGRRGFRYADLCLFAGGDETLAAEVRSGELRHFRERPRP